MRELARGHEKPDVLFSCGEFTAEEIIEHWPEVVRGSLSEPLRQGLVS